MINFKEIAEKCLAGKLSGTFVIQGERNWHSSTLSRHMIAGHEMPGQYVIGPGVIYNAMGQCESRKEVRIIDFISDNMQNQIKIDIPEGKVPVMEQTENGVVITWKEKAKTYADVESQLKGLPIVYKYINVDKLKECRSKNFYKKVEVLRKLTNIRNYFGKPDDNENGFYIDLLHQAVPNGFPSKYASETVVFAKKEHAEQAVKMLGDELKYLFEPW